VVKLVGREDVRDKRVYTAIKPSRTASSIGSTTGPVVMGFMRS
jgi:hypothetical protein